MRPESSWLPLSIYAYDKLTTERGIPRDGAAEDINPDLGRVIGPLRSFFEMDLLSSAQWFLALFSAAVGLTIASVLWRLPQIERLEELPAGD